MRISDWSSDVCSSDLGNQQRVVLARWMERQPKLMSLNGPTVGVDVGSKREIHELLLALSRAGTAVMVVTDDLGEALALSDRVLVMVRGAITAAFDGEAADEERLNAEVTRAEPKGAEPMGAEPT